MRHFRINIALSIIATIASGAAAALCLASGHTPWAILCALGCAVAVAVLVRLIWKPVRTMGRFADALEMGDTSMRFSADESDPDLRMLGATMNRVLAMQHSNRLELETRKLYYDRILSVMTHEMRNSITPVIALASDMRRHPERYSGATGAEALDVILAQSEGIKRFLDSYHKLTHLPKPERQPVDAIRFFGEIRTAFESRCVHDGLPAGMVSYTVPVGTTLDIDPDLMRQAVGNLIGNAIHAASRSEHPSVEVTVSQTGGRPFIAISDNGPGISPAMQPSLFQPFITDKPGGTGIGLCLARQIARLHGGDLRLASSAPSGATFVIEL